MIFGILNVYIVKKFIFQPSFLSVHLIENLNKKGEVSVKNCSEMRIIMKKIYFVLFVIALITCLTGIPYLLKGIAERGIDGVNYGRVIFPFFISYIFFLVYKKSK